MTAHAKFRKAAILSTGTEIMQGLYADTNAQHLAAALAPLGIEVAAIAAAPDDAAQIEASLRFLASQADLVICSGGLGPTEDDVNREAFARVFGARLVRDDEAVSRMRERFAARGRTMPENNEVQAMVPEGATVFQNEWGTAPGFFLPAAEERGGGTAVGESVAARCALIALPGPPKEMIPMLRTRVLPLLSERRAGGAFVSTRTIHTFGRPESELNECTRDLFRRDPAVVFTILAKGHGVDFRVTARAANEDTMNRHLSTFEELVRERVGTKSIYGVDDDTMASVTARMLLAAGRTVATAESCTGGLVAKFLTDIPGSSAYMLQGWVTYTDESKKRQLGVAHATLELHGAVSEETAREMAEGARCASGAYYAVALTGIAGPDGGTDEKPVGLVYIALAMPEETKVHRSRFLGDREQVRLLASLTAIDMIRRNLAE
jgi:nicotinamide-nucleotide amidase